MIWSPLYLLPFRLLNRMWWMQTEFFDAKVRIAAFFFLTKQVERWTWRLLSHFFSFHQFKKESNASSRNKGKKTLYRDYLHCIANFYAIVLNIFSKKDYHFPQHQIRCRKQILKFISNAWKCWWNKTDDENFTCVCPLSLNFETYFLDFPWEIVSGFISGSYLYF